MKKIKLLLVLSAVIFAGYQIHAKEKNHSENSKIRAQFAQLLQEHQSFLKTAYHENTTGVVNASYGDFEENFFMNVAFFQDSQIQNFLKNVEYDIENSGHTGYTMMSYTNIIMTGGQTHSIQYTYRSHGDDIQLIKQTSNNGKLLKSVYNFNVQDKSLKTDDMIQDNVIFEKVYTI